MKGRRGTRRWLGAYLGAALLCAGCYRTTVRSGAPVVETPGAVHRHWHHGLLLGAVDLGGAYDLQSDCPGGWGEIEVRSEFLQGLISLGTLMVYTPQTVTVYCASPRAPRSR